MADRRIVATFLLHFCDKAPHLGLGPQLGGYLVLDFTFWIALVLFVVLLGFSAPGCVDETWIRCAG